jgi:hypothetical protein
VTVLPWSSRRDSGKASGDGDAAAAGLAARLGLGLATAAGELDGDGDDGAAGDGSGRGLGVTIGGAVAGLLLVACGAGVLAGAQPSSVVASSRAKQ